MIVNLFQVLENIAAAAIAYKSARRYCYIEVFAARSSLIGSTSVKTFRSPPELAVSEMGKVVQRSVDPDIYTSAVSTGTTIRASSRHMLLPAKANAPVPSDACLDQKFNAIDKQGGSA
jgi:hypothetical protein